MDDDPTLRPQVLALMQRAGELRADADEAADQAMFWAGLVDHGHKPGDSCDQIDCLQAWEEYPNG